jgi:hypothetical protein
MREEVPYSEVPIRLVFSARRREELKSKSKRVPAKGAARGHKPKGSKR